MTTFEIKSIYGNLLFSCEASSLREAVESAVASGARLVGAYLVGACLDGANLDGARLDGANLDGANLDGARLDGARLDGANLDGANLDGARLDGARLDGANLVDANLDGIRDDLYGVLAAAPAEVAGLLEALRDGRVNGSAYIANLRSADYRTLEGVLEPNVSTASEAWFLGIGKGATPATNQVSRITVEWIEQWMRENGHVVPLHVPLVWRGDIARLARELRDAGVDVAALAEAK